MRLAVYTDDPYRLHDERVGADMAFALFLEALSEHFEEVVILGRLDERRENEERAPHHLLAPDTLFVALPFWADLSRPGAFLRLVPETLRRAWCAFGSVDAVWLLGPSPAGLAFVLLAALRGRSIAVGARMDYPRYVRSRHPHRRALHRAADLLEAVWRLLARRAPAIVVGKELVRRYGGGGETLNLAVSLVDESDVLDPSHFQARTYAGCVRILSVGRLDAEKNPLLLVDILARLPDRWTLVVCGDGPLAYAVEQRARALGVHERIFLRGYVGDTSALRDAYRSSDVLLHVSQTEGVPQVLLEAFAAGLPCVATDVGSVREIAQDASLLVPPDDAEGAARALERIASEPELRVALTARASARVRGMTRQAQTARVARFLGSRAVA